VGKVEGKTTQPPTGAKDDGTTVPSGLTDALPGKGGDTFPGKMSESPPVPPPSSPMPEESQQQLEDMGFDTDAFGGAASGESGGGTSEPSASTTPSPSSSVGTEESGTTSDEQGGTEESEGQQGSGPDIDKMAREVYNVLRDRLRIEHERRSKR
jgi:hypothetical protein